MQADVPSAVACWGENIEMDREQPSSLAPRPSARWFVSAPARTDVRRLLARLQRRGIEPFVLSDVALLGVDLRTSIEAAISAADRVLIVISSNAESANQMFEAGLALGLGKPVVLLAESAATVPAGLQDQFTIRASADDAEALDFALDQAAGRLPQSAARIPAEGRPLGDHVDVLLERVRALSTEAPGALERSIVDVIVEAVEASGPVAVPAGAGDPSYDIGIWSDDLATIAANPLVIGFKRRLSAATVQQALKALQAVQGRHLVLLLYLERTASDATLLRQLHFPLLAIEIVELLERMRTASFAEVVRDLRNRSVHGWPTS